MTKEEFHNRIDMHEFFEDEMNNPYDGGWRLSQNGDIYISIGDELVNNGYSRQHALNILGTLGVITVTPHIQG